jgi:hypothetical protein
VKFENLLLSRLLDQISILSQLELEAKTIRSTDKELNGWEGLPQGKLSLRNDSLELLNCILDLHAIFLIKFEMNGSIESHGKLFWVNMGLLHLNSNDFTETVFKAMDNILFFFARLDRAKLDNFFLYPLDSKEGRSCDIQSLLIPHIFGANGGVQDKAILILLNSWIVFPAVTVDASKTALLYTILYVVSWIFIRISQNHTNDTFLEVLDKLEQFLLIYYPTEIEDLQRGVDRLKEIVSSNPSVPFEAQQIIFKQCSNAVCAYFVKEYGNNIAQYLAQIISINDTYCRFGLQMTQRLWITTQEFRLNLNNYHQIKVLMKGIPFIKNVCSERDDLVLLIFRQSSEIKDVDVASQGRFEPLPPFECSSGSIRATWNWLHTDLGVLSSNKMFGLM